MLKSFVSLTALAATIPSVVNAQTADTAASAPSSASSSPRNPGNTGQTAEDAGTGTQEIVVTALRRAQSELSVPAAISVVGGGDLKTVGVNTVNDLQNLVPGVTIGTGAFGTNISIRGVTSTDQTSKGELGIAFNIDGAFIGRGQEQGVAFFDLDRVEVLRGPQGTLYGRSSTGGAINVITKKPVLDDLSGYAKLEFGNYNAKRAEAAVNIPLNSVLAIRVAGNFNERDGYLKPTTTTATGATGSTTIPNIGEPAKNDQSDRTGRFSLLFKPSDALTFTGVATVGHIGGEGPADALEDSLRAGGGKKFDIVSNPVPAWQRLNFRSFNEQLNWKFGGAQLDVLANEQHFTDHSQTTGNGNPYDTGDPTAAPRFSLDKYDATVNTNQVEARISNVEQGFLDYVAGANYYREKTSPESDHTFYAPLTSTGGVADSSLWSTGISPLVNTQHRSYGFFGQATVHLASKLSLIGGVRYTHDLSERTGTFAVNTPAAECPYPNPCAGPPTGGRETDHKITWKAGLDFQADPRNLFYASVSTGFKAGGFNDFDPRTGAIGVPYKPESLTAYEFGYKGRPFRNLTFTSSAFYYDYSADQISGLALFFGPSGVTGVLYTQVVSAKIYGWENEARYQLGRNTFVTAGVAYEHSDFGNFQTGYLGYLTGIFANFKGYSLSNLPKITVNLSASHTFDLGDDRELRFRVGSKISDGYWLNDYANAVRFRQPGFTRTDLTLTYALPRDAVTVQLFVENIENRLQRTAGPNGYNGAYGGFTGGVHSAEVDGTSYPGQSASFGVTTPRFFGVRLGVKF